jgi:hypothetical protein
MRRSAAVASLLLASIALCCVLPEVARADGDLFWAKPTIQIGGHAETGGGVLPGSGFDSREQGGGVALALSLMVPTRPRVHLGLAGEMSAARAVVEHQTAVGDQSYGVASVRTMARVEFWSHPPFDRGSSSGLYALLGAGWNFNATGTKVTYLAGAPDGTAADLHLANRPAFEVGGGLELSRKRDGIFIAEVTWVYNSGPYQLQVFGEPDRHGTFDLGGLTFLIGLRFNPQRDSDEP